MFFIIAVLFLLLGGLIFWKANRMVGKQSLRIAAGIGGALLAAWGAGMIYCLLSGKIQLPLY